MAGAGPWEKYQPAQPWETPWEKYQRLQDEPARAARDVLPTEEERAAASTTDAREAAGTVRGSFGSARPRDTSILSPAMDATLSAPGETPWERYQREKNGPVGQGAIEATPEVEAGVGSILTGLANTGRATNEAMQQILTDAAPAPFLDEAQKSASAASQMRDLQQAQERADRERPQFDSPIAAGAYSVAESIIQQLPGLAASAATGNVAPSLAWAGATTGTQAYGKYRARGATPGEAALGGIGEGSVEVATELIPMGKYLDAIGGPKAAKSFFIQVGKATLTDIPGEQIATLAQDAIDTAIANPDKTWGQYLAERPNAALQTLVATIGQGAIMAGGGYAVNQAIGQERPVPPGVIEAATTEAAQLTPEDIDSPLPNDLIAEGKAIVGAGEASGRADTILAEAGMPHTSAAVKINMPGGRTVQGVIEDAFAGENGSGVKIRLDDGSLFEEHFDDIRDAGVTIEPVRQAPAEIAADMASRADEAQARAEQALTEFEAMPALEPPLAAPTEGTGASLPIPSPAAPGNINDAIASFKNRTRRAESGGDDTAKNPRSSASGRYQFTDSTWLATYKAEFGDTGESEGAILAKKRDGAVQERMMDRLTRDNAAALQQAGIPVNDTSLYVAHFAGITGARSLYGANPNASVESVLGAGVVGANPFLKGMTVAEAISDLGRRIGAKGDAQAATAPTEAAPAEPDGPNPYEQALADYEREQAARPTEAQAAEPEILKPLTPEAAPEAPQMPLATMTGETGTAGAARPVYGGTPAGPDAEVGTQAEREAPAPSITTDKLRVFVRDASPGLVERINSALPEGTALKLRQDGAYSVPKRYRGVVEAALAESAPVASVAGEQIDGEWTRFTPDSGTLAIPRDAMPQIKAENRGAMVNFLNARGIAHEEQTVPAAGLKPTQEEFSPAKVRKAQEYEGGDRAILVSSDDYVLDGHHQWLAAREAGEPIRVIKLDAPIRDLINTVREMPTVETAQGEDVPVVAPTAQPAPEPTAPASVVPDDAAAAGSQLTPPQPPAVAAVAPQTREIPAKRTPRVRSDKTLLEWIADRGGINDTGGDLKSMGADRWHRQRPFRKKLLRQFDAKAALGGISGAGDYGMDTTLRAAIEAGYFPELTNAANEPGVSAIDASVLLAAIQRELEGKPQYSSASKAFERQQEPASQAEEDYSDEERVEAYSAMIADVALHEFGVEKLDPDFLDYASRLKLDQGLSERDAFITAVNAYADEYRQRAFEESEKERYIPAYDDRSPTAEPAGEENLPDEADRAGPEPVAEDEARRESGSATADSNQDGGQPELDRGEAVDPAIADRQRQEAQLRAEAPMRGENKTGQAQDGTMGMGLFDAADQPEMDLAPKKPAPPKNRIPLGAEADAASDISAMADLEAVADRLHDRLDELNVDPRVRLSVLNFIGSIGGRPITGQFLEHTSGDALIRVALTTGRQTPEMTLDHEAVHALRWLGVFRDAEWNALERGALADKELMASIRQRYDGLPEEVQTEEAVADMFMQWRAGRETTGFARKAFERVVDFFRALSQVLRGAGFTTPESVMRAIGRGDIGARDGDVQPINGERNMVVYHGTPHDFDEFSLDRIGSGEGAQVYGWGLYFTDRKEIAQHYRDKLTRDPKAVATWNGKTADELQQNLGTANDPSWDALQAIVQVEGAGSIDAAIAHLNRAYAGDRFAQSTRQWLEDHRDEIDVKKSGRLYEVDIPNDGEYLLWDRPLDQQPEVVKQALLRLPDGAMDQINDRLDEQGYNPVELDDGAYTGAELYRMLSRVELDVPTDGSNGKQDATTLLRSLGIAGIKYLDGGSRKTGDGSYNYVLFDDSRAKVVNKYSITDAPFDAAPDGGAGGVSRPQTASLLASMRDNPKLDAIRDKIDQWRVVVQDKMLPVMRQQQAVSQALGRDIAESENPYLAEELMTGKVGAQLEQLSDEIVDPLFHAMHEQKVSTDELETYLYARHAAERNAQIAKINPEFTEGTGSGMTDTQAAAILGRIDKAGKTQTMEALAGYVDRMLDQSLQTRVDAGLLSQEEAEAWRSTYKHYVPLRGRAEVEDDAGEQKERVRSQSGMSVKGKESKRAFGRRSEADNILAYAILQAEEAIVRAEKNRVAQSFLHLAEASPDPEFWSVNKVRRVPVMDQTTGLVRYELQSRLSAEDAPYTVTAKVGGDEMRVTMNRDNPKAANLAEAMRNLEVPKFNKLMAAASTFNRYFSAINTRYNPTFVVTNAVRDLQTMAVVGQKFDLPGLTRRVVRDYVPALLASKRGDGTWAKWRREWELAGGKVYYNQAGDLEQIRKDIQTRTKRLTNPNMAARAWVKAFDMLEAMNESVERAIRLGVYKNAREMGKSKAEAASMARNITVNFTRKGTMGPAMNSFYAFFNASTQGSANLILAGVKSKKVRRAMAGFIVAGFLSDMFNSMLSGDDDDGESYWDKMPEFEKSRNAVFMLPGGKDGQAVKLPLAYGLNALFGLGRNASAMMRGAMTPGEAALGSAKEFADAFNPVGDGGSWLNILAPTLLDPAIDITENKDFTGKPIQPERNPFEPEPTPSSNMFPNVSTWAKQLSQAMNSATGGDEVLPGAASVSPEVLEYLSGFLTGGSGRFVSDVWNLVTAPGDPEAEITIRDVPFARSLVTQKAPWVDKGLYYDRVHQVEAVLDHAKSYAERGDREALRRYVEENREIGRMEAATKEASKLMRKVRKARNEASFEHEMGRLGDEVYRERIGAVRAAEERIIAAYNQRWNSVMEAEKAE